MAKEEDLTARWATAMHAVQAGVAMEMEQGSKDTTPKHLRVGVNAAMSDHGSLAALLVKKGVITELEYLEAIAEGAEREKLAYESRLSARFGRKITLG